MRNDCGGEQAKGLKAWMNRRFAGFPRLDSGGASIEYLVMAAAAVGLGLATTVAVRDGVGTMGNTTGTSLSGGAVLAAAVPSGGGGTSPGTGGGTGTDPDISYPLDSLPDYSFRHYDQATFDSLLAWVRNDFTDDMVSQEYSYQVDFLLQNGANDSLSRETLDWIYVMAYELTRRGIGYASGERSFDQVVAAYEAMITPVVAPPRRTPRVAPTR